MEAVRLLVVDVLGFLDTHHNATASAASHTFLTFLGAQWHAQLAETLSTSFHETCLAYFESGSAVALLGNMVHIPMLTGLAKYNVKGIDVHVSRIFYSFESVGLLLVQCCLQL